METVADIAARFSSDPEKTRQEVQREIDACARVTQCIATRLACGASVTEIAKLMGVKRTELFRLERGNDADDPDLLLKYEMQLGIQPS